MGSRFRRRLIVSFEDRVSMASKRFTDEFKTAADNQVSERNYPVAESIS